MRRGSAALALFALAAMVFAVRLMPHAWGATPLAAAALFAAARFGIWGSVAASVGAMVASDLFLGLYDPKIMAAVYASVAVTGAIGLLLKGRPGAFRIGAASVASSTLFFLVTNWAVWQFGTMYSHDLAGLMRSYALGLPFFKSALAGDLVYSGMLFGAYEFFARRSIVSPCFKTPRSRPTRAEPSIPSATGLIGTSCRAR